MSDLAAYKEQMQSVNESANERAARMEAMLREWITPPLAYRGKKDLLERTRLLIEGWE